MTRIVFQFAVSTCVLLLHITCDVVLLSAAQLPLHMHFEVSTCQCCALDFDPLCLLQQALFIMMLSCFTLLKMLQNQAATVCHVVMYYHVSQTYISFFSQLQSKACYFNSKYLLRFFPAIPIPHIFLEEIFIEIHEFLQ